VFNEILRFAQDDSQNEAVLWFAGAKKVWDYYEIRRMVLPEK
jgi:hypothetical protein